MALSANLRGALFMSVSMAGFTINDALVKGLTHSINAGQIMLVRGLFAVLLLVLLMAWSGKFGRLTLLLDWRVAVRIVCETFATVAFLFTLAHMPLGNISAILQALPLTVTIGAALFFSEPVGWRRWSAIAVGFIGVLIIVRPGLQGFSTWSLLVLVCVAFSTARDLVTRLIPVEASAVSISAATAFAVALCGGALVGPLGGWTPLSSYAIFILFLAAAAIIFGYQFIILAMRLGDISYAAPFRYTALLWSILFGYLFFAEVPDAPMLLGSFIIVCSGLYTLYRERVVGRKRPITSSTGPGMTPEGT